MDSKDWTCGWVPSMILTSINRGNSFFSLNYRHHHNERPPLVPCSIPERPPNLLFPAASFSAAEWIHIAPFIPTLAAIEIDSTGLICTIGKLIKIAATPARTCGCECLARVGQMFVCLQNWKRESWLRRPFMNICLQEAAPPLCCRFNLCQLIKKNCFYFKLI